MGNIFPFQAYFCPAWERFSFKPENVMRFPRSLLYEVFCGNEITADQAHPINLCSDIKLYHIFLAITFCSERMKEKWTLRDTLLKPIFNHPHCNLKRLSSK